MAVYQFQNATFTLKFLTGQNAEGESVYKKVTYRNIVETVTADQLNTVALALASLTDFELVDVEKTEKQYVM
ncbi:DUF1659 domain-containing protein [Lysinibacillus sp. KU-BSD001]|uniref:DUF1659 domain-containing protein n=1 Tax=Lysinibacillus sp. KU-BSD001 TaxID=3141328 RepID=UPI0036E6C437